MSSASNRAHWEQTLARQLSRAAVVPLEAITTVRVGTPPRRGARNGSAGAAFGNPGGAVTPASVFTTPFMRTELDGIRPFSKTVGTTINRRLPTESPGAEVLSAVSGNVLPPTCIGRQRQWNWDGTAVRNAQTQGTGPLPLRLKLLPVLGLTRIAGALWRGGCCTPTTLWPSTSAWDSSMPCPLQLFTRCRCRLAPKSKAFFCSNEDRAGALDRVGL